jgi:hypothetical protein
MRQRHVWKAGGYMNAEESGEFRASTMVQHQRPADGDPEQRCSEGVR